MIPDFKTYITESIWSDIQDRSMGKTVRKEDDINLLDINEFCEYLKTIYKTNSDNDISVIKIEDNMYLTICLYEDEYGYYRYIYYDGDYINTQLDVIETLKCLLEFERKFSIKFNENDFVVNCIDIYPKDKARIPVTNKFFIEVLDFILDRINTPLEQKIKKISNIKESIWSDIQDRSMGKTVRKEDIALTLVIDGEKYTFLTDFWDLGDEYNDENSYEWRCFAFNKPKDGTKTIRGNGEDTGVFGYDRWDIGEDEYDIYVLKDYIDYSKEELVENAMDSYYLDNSDYIVQGILRKYVTDVFENHMSDYAKFWIYELMNSDVDKNMVIAYCEGTDYSEINAIKDEFDNIYDARMFLYPAIEGWYEGLEKELTEAYEKAGWVKSKSYEPDWNNSDIPGGVMGLCFVKLTDD